MGGSIRGTSGGAPRGAGAEGVGVTAGALGIPAVRRPSPSGEGRPDASELVDRFGRVARDLRISLTEKCSLRCTYCMPAEGLPSIPRSQVLTAEEVGRLVGIAGTRLGVHEVRFTGGEPLVRPDIVEIVRLSAAAAPGVPLSMTTNGIGLDKKAAALAAAGLARVNVSLDTLDREHFRTLTRRARLPAGRDGIAAGQTAGLGPPKLNAVPMPDTLAATPDLLGWAVERGI